jgi:hypothetical protein
MIQDWEKYEIICEVFVDGDWIENNDLSIINLSLFRYFILIKLFAMYSLRHHRFATEVAKRELITKKYNKTYNV